jgi:peroxiredoxin
MVSLESLRGRPVVLLFFPAAFSSVCTTEMCAMGDDLAAYREVGAEVLAISVDSPYALKRYREDCGVDFTFLSDFHREATKLYGVLREGTLGPGLREVADRSAFVIDGEGVVRFAWHSTNPGVLPPLEEVREAARAAATA